MSERAAPAPGLALSEAIGLLRDRLLEAHAAAASPIQLPVESMPGYPGVWKVTVMSPRLKLGRQQTS